MSNPHGMKTSIVSKLRYQNLLRFLKKKNSWSFLGWILNESTHLSKYFMGHNKEYLIVIIWHSCSPSHYHKVWQLMILWVHIKTSLPSDLANNIVETQAHVMKTCWSQAGLCISPTAHLQFPGLLFLSTTMQKRSQWSVYKECAVDLMGKWVISRLVRDHRKAHGNLNNHWQQHVQRTISYLTQHRPWASA